MQFKDFILKNKTISPGFVWPAEESVHNFLERNRKWNAIDSAWRRNAYSQRWRASRSRTRSAQRCRRRWNYRSWFEKKTKSIQLTNCNRQRSNCISDASPGLNSKLTTESARGIADDMVAAKLGDGEVCRVKGLAAVRRDVDCRYSLHNYFFFSLTNKLKQLSRLIIFIIHHYFIDLLHFPYWMGFRDEIEKNVTKCRNCPNDGRNNRTTSYPLREGGLGTAMLLKVGVLPLELGAGNRPCLGGRVGTISPTSSNRSSPAVQPFRVIWHGTWEKKKIKKKTVNKTVELDVTELFLVREWIDTCRCDNSSVRWSTSNRSGCVRIGRALE